MLERERDLARAGYDVAVLARGTDALAATVAEVAASGRRAVGIVTDVSQHEAVDAAAARVESELGPIEAWVNNAMAGVFAEFTRTAPADFERALAVTYLGFVNGTRAALRHMQPRDRGVVVQVGSALAFRGIPLQASYCGAKHAMVGFTESVITELLHQRSKVRVAMVQMPALNTPQFDWVTTDLPEHPQPVAPIYQPEVGSRAVLRAVQHPRRNSWVGISTAGTILGNRVAPGLIDRYLGRTGYQGQQQQGTGPSQLGTNLHEPVPGDQGAHGDFDDRSHERSQLLWAAEHRGTLLGALAVTTAAALAAATRRRS